MSKLTPIKATKIKMMKDKEDSYKLQEIDSIYLTGKIEKEKYYTKDSIYDALKKGIEIAVNIEPYPLLIPIEGENENYVRSSKNDTEEDNLLKLPRE